MAYTQNLRKANVAIAGTTGDNTLIAGVSGRSILVMGLNYTCDAGTNVTYWDGTSSGGNQISGAFKMVANGSQYEQDVAEPVYVCSPGNAFTLNQSGTANINGYIRYQLL